MPGVLDYPKHEPSDCTYTTSWSLSSFGLKRDLESGDAREIAASAENIRSRIEHCPREIIPRRMLMIAEMALERYAVAEEVMGEVADAVEYGDLKGITEAGKCMGIVVDSDETRHLLSLRILLSIQNNYGSEKCSSLYNKFQKQLEWNEDRIDDLIDGMSTYPKNLDLIVPLYQTLKDTEHEEKALTILRAFAYQYPENLLIQNYTTLCLFELKRYEDAYQVALRALAVHEGQTAATHFNVGFCLLHMEGTERLNEAEGYLRTALLHCPVFPRVQYALSVLSARRGEFDNAQVYAQNALDDALKQGSVCDIDLSTNHLRDLAWWQRSAAS